MITTLTPNPCIDKTLTVEKFDTEKMNRARVLRSDLGGKGINVSLALRNLKVATTCLGIGYREEAQLISQFMEQNGIPYEFTEVPGSIRTCTKLFDQSTAHSIEINEYGAPIPASAGEALLQLLEKYATKSSYVALSGSLPPGLGEDFYYRCVKAIHAAAPTCRIIVDAEKKLLRKALEASPWMLKPNIHEFQDTFGVQVNSVEELDREVRKIMAEYGLGLVCVSLGKEGAYICNGKEAWSCEPARVTVRSTQGAGDSMIAGICTALEQGCPLSEVLKYGVAAASDSISKEGTLLCTQEGVEKILASNLLLYPIG